MQPTEPNLVVKTAQGKLLGTERTSDLDGIGYYAFLGIPYAKPPIGNLRFMVSSCIYLNLCHQFRDLQSSTPRGERVNNKFGSKYYFLRVTSTCNFNVDQCLVDNT